MQKTLNIPQKYSKVVYRRRTDNTMVKRQKDRQYNGQKTDGQTIQWSKEEGQTIQWSKEGQTIQWSKEKGQTIQWSKEEGQKDIHWSRKEYAKN